MALPSIVTHCTVSLIAISSRNLSLRAAAGFAEAATFMACFAADRADIHASLHGAQRLDSMNVGTYRPQDEQETCRETGQTAELSEVNLAVTSGMDSLVNDQDVGVGEVARHVWKLDYAVMHSSAA